MFIMFRVDIAMLKEEKGGGKEGSAGKARGNNTQPFWRTVYSRTTRSAD
jgi:hypothetical protein